MLMGQSTHVSASAFLQPALHPGTLDFSHFSYTVVTITTVISMPVLPVRVFAALPPLKRSIRFQRSDAALDPVPNATPTNPPPTTPAAPPSSKIFVCCDISPRVEGNGAGYVAVLREGELPDTGVNGESMRFIAFLFNLRSATL